MVENLENDSNKNTRDVQFLDGSAVIDNIKKALRRPNRRTVKEPRPTNAFDNTGRDENFSEIAMSREEFERKRRNITVNSRITPRGKDQLKKYVESLTCPVCGLNSMIIAGRDKEFIDVTCSNKFCTNNARGPFKFNAWKHVHDHNLVPRRIDEPVRFW